MNMPLKKRYNYCSIENGNSSSMGMHTAKTICKRKQHKNIIRIDIKNIRVYFSAKQYKYYNEEPYHEQ